MLLAADAVTIAGIAVGTGLWFGLVYAVYRWGPFEEDRSLVASVRAAVARDRERRRGSTRRR
jgi:hypothetical protein